MTPLSNPGELHQVRQITGGDTENPCELGGRKCNPCYLHRAIPRLKGGGMRAEADEF